MVAELLKPVLVIVVGFLLKAIFSALKLEVDAAFFNALVLAIVTYLLVLVGVEGAIRAGLLAR